MPRRYSDYPDCFYVWNKVSSLGSFMTVLRVFFFMVILWESFVTQRSVIFTFNKSIHLEWFTRLPTSFHTHNESVKVFY
jgi:hypothetical protein